MLHNTVEFPEFNLILNNLEGNDMEQLIKSPYNPISSPRSPVFILEDIFKYTINAGETYEEMARFGAVINLTSIITVLLIVFSNHQKITANLLILSEELIIKK